MAGRHFIPLMILLAINQLSAQVPTVAGEYYLAGVMEIASGFRLNADSTFNFFYSYGALDRGGNGTWSVEDSVVLFNSKSRAGDAFLLSKSNKTKAGGLTVRIDDPNPFFKRYVHGFVKGKGGEEEQSSDHDGMLRFQQSACDSLLMMMEFCPEKIFRVNLSENENNEFVFTFNPSLLEVFFTNYKLKITGNGLTGQHPLLQEKEYIFERVQ
ncbi:MAG TPA: hypothetical protein PLU53_01755 [Bacteroidia bacterium]|nr:hypothetical protein [Bacteroidia bacterium]